MCGGAPREPQVVETGPTKKEFKQQRKELKDMRQEMRDSQQDFRQQLQEQIDAANAAAAEAAAEAAAVLEQQQASAAAASQAYVTEVTQAKPGAGALTTAAVPKPKPTRASSLTIGARSSSASGLNIGR